MNILEKIKSFFKKETSNNLIVEEKKEQAKEKNLQKDLMKKEKINEKKINNKNEVIEEQLFGVDVATINHGMTIRVKIEKEYNDFYYAQPIDTKYFQTITIYKKDCGDKKYNIKDEIEIFVYRVTEEEILGKPIFIKNFNIGDIIHFRNAKKTEKGYVMYIYNKRFFLPFQEISRLKVNKNNAHKYIKENDELKIIEGTKDSFIVSKKAMKIEEPIIEGKNYEGYIVNIFDYGYLIAINSECVGLLRFEHSSNKNVNRNLQINNKLNVKVLKVDGNKILLVASEKK